MPDPPAVVAEVTPMEEDDITPVPTAPAPVVQPQLRSVPVPVIQPRLRSVPVPVPPSPPVLAAPSLALPTSAAVPAESAREPTVPASPPSMTPFVAIVVPSTEIAASGVPSGGLSSGDLGTALQKLVQACLVRGRPAPTSPVEALREARNWVLELNKSRADRASMAAIKESLAEFFESQALTAKARLKVEYATRFGDL